MSVPSRLCSIAHLLALGVWLGSSAMTGVVAAVVFPIMRALDPALPAYAAYEGAHWSLAAGHVAARVFAVADAIQFAAAVVALATLALSLLAGWFPRAGVATLVRVALMLALIGVVSYTLLMLGPRMDESMRAYWRAAEAGDNAAAALHKDRFDAMHPVAARLMIVTTLLVLASFVVAAWTLVGPPRSDPARPAPPPRDAAPPLEEPRLLSRRNP